MSKQSKYISKTPDANGYVAYSDEEQSVWHDLFQRQMQLLKSRACAEYLQGIEDLGITANEIPQVPDVNKRLRALSGWEISPVPALIDFQAFFELMSNKKFPAATFIRTREELDYLQEPDIFHEVFGHCPLITLPVYANFMHEYAKLGLNAEHADRVMLARLSWFTVEFGLIKAGPETKIYGGGILSSFGESKYCLDSDKPIIKPLDPLEAFRTPYRIDIMQPLYFTIEDFSELFDLIKLDLLGLVKEARALGMHKPLFAPREDDGRFL
jgi:phenylalanine-4-hydroxylase